MFKITDEIKAALKVKDPIMALLVTVLSPDDKIVEKEALSGLIHIVIGQQLSNHVMQVLIKRFDDAFSPLSRDHLSQFSVSDFKTIGLSLSKSETIKRIIDAPTDYDELTHQPNDQIIKVLTGIKGLGPWSADMFIMFIKGDPDYFSVYDGGINSAIESFYEGFYPEDFKEHYSPYGTYACFYLWESLNHKALITKTIKNHLEESLKWKNI